MNEETQREVLGIWEALENIALELERLRVLKEYELGVRVENDEGSLSVKPLEK